MVDISIINDTKKNIKVTYAQEVLNLAPQQTKVVKMATKEQIIKIEVDRKKQKYKEQLILQGRPQLTASMNIYFDKACKLQVKSHNWVTLILKFYLTREH